MSLQVRGVDLTLEYAVHPGTGRSEWGVMKWTQVVGDYTGSLGGWKKRMRRKMLSFKVEES